MPVFSVTAVDRLIDPVAASSSSSSSAMETGSLSSTDSKLPFSFYPLLYVTPPQQRPPSPASFSPSPYVLNYKRRNPVQNGVVGAEGTVGTHTHDAQENIVSQSSAILDGKEQAEGAASFSTFDLKIGKLKKVSQETCNDKLDEDENSGRISAGEKWAGDKAAKVSWQQIDNEVFEIEIIPGDQTENNHPSEIFASRQSGQIGIMSRDKLPGKEASGGDRKDQSLRVGSDGSQLACSIATLTSEEFFDAPDAPFDDSTSDDETCLSNSTTRSHMKSGQKMTARLQEEVARRVQAEEALESLQLQLNGIARKCPPSGLSLLSGPCQLGFSENEQEQADSSEFSQKLSIARFVAGAIATAAVRAVKDEELEGIVMAKNREISRLRDKLQYYELVNHEMSQRNQEAVEIAQRRRRRHRKRLRWALGCLGGVVGIGSASLICYKFIPWERARDG